MKQLTKNLHGKIFSEVFIKHLSRYRFENNFVGTSKWLDIGKHDAQWCKDHHGNRIVFYLFFINLILSIKIHNQNIDGTFTDPSCRQGIKIYVTFVQDTSILFNLREKNQIIDLILFYFYIT